MGLRVKVKKADHEVEIYSGSRYRCSVICRSMDAGEYRRVQDRPRTGRRNRPAGCQQSRGDLAQDDRPRSLERTRCENGIDVTTTPEGFKFVHRTFLKAVRDKPERGERYGLVQASTYDNEKNLPDDYIDAMLEQYPPELIDAYLNGQFP